MIVYPGRPDDSNNTNDGQENDHGHMQEVSRHYPTERTQDADYPEHVILLVFYIIYQNLSFVKLRFWQYD